MLIHIPQADAHGEPRRGTTHERDKQGALSLSVLFFLLVCLACAQVFCSFFAVLPVSSSAGTVPARNILGVSVLFCCYFGFPFAGTGFLRSVRRGACGWGRASVLALCVVISRHAVACAFEERRFYFAR
ncbi:hypothetical protein B0H15DRAFT_341578 [Mycena belliarum]|uniref:Transmembrane protein n=1 Tax=Mycena belliarum TaxID=1033014 RepID=A0AAD6XQA2_9AGAR|nr:hypothetical protein B0H15DRAFT_341578 [Mycena belliae]